MIKIDKSKVMITALVVFLFGGVVVVMYFTMGGRRDKIQRVASAVSEYPSAQEVAGSTEGDVQEGQGDSAGEAGAGQLREQNGVSPFGSGFSRFDMDAHRTLGDIYFHREEFSKALKHYERIVNYYAGSERDTILARKAISYMNIYEFDEAMTAAGAISKNYDAILREILILRTRFEKALFFNNSAEILAVVKRVNSLVERIEKNVPENQKNSYEVYMNLAEMLFYSGALLKEVEKYLNLAIASNNVKKDYRAYVLKGKILLNNKRHSQAVQHFLKATQYFPFNGKIHNLLGLSYHNLGNHRKALNHFNIAISVNPYNYESHFNKGILYKKTNQDSLAFNSFRRAYEVNNHNFKALYNISLIYGSHNDHRKAVLVLERAFEILRSKKGKLDKNDIDMGLSLVNFYREISTEKYNSKAMELLIELCLIDPLNNKALSRYEQLTGRIFRISKYQQ